MVANFKDLKIICWIHDIVVKFIVKTNAKYDSLDDEDKIYAMIAIVGIPTLLLPLIFFPAGVVYLITLFMWRLCYFKCRWSGLFNKVEEPPEESDEDRSRRESFDPREYDG